jgi:hypothetical protein
MPESRYIAFTPRRSPSFRGDAAGHTIPSNTSRSSAMQGTPRCAHCNVEIKDQSTMVSRGNDTFCCNNCAMAMQAGQ